MRYGFLCGGAVIAALALTGGPAGAYAAQSPSPVSSAAPAVIGTHSPSPAGTVPPAAVKTETPSPTATGERLLARLTGSQEVPPNTSPGTGTARITVNVAHSQVCWDMTVRKLQGKVTGAHIHRGPVGEVGPIVVPLQPSTGPVSKGCKTVTHSVAEGILMHPEAYYVNVHTSKFSDGEVRGQLSTV